MSNGFVVKRMILIKYVKGLVHVQHPWLLCLEYKYIKSLNVQWIAFVALPLFIWRIIYILYIYAIGSSSSGYYSFAAAFSTLLLLHRVFKWLACMPCSSTVESCWFPALVLASISGGELAQQDCWQEQATFWAGLMEPCKHGNKVRQQEKARQGGNWN